MCLILFVVPAKSFQQNLASNAGKGGKVKGTIVDAGNKEMAVAGANVTVVGTDLGGASMPNGFFLITNIPPGTWKVKALHLSYLSQEKTVTVREGEEVQLDFELTRKEGNEFFTAQREEQDPRDTSIYFVTAEVLPEPIGGIATIQRNVVYPEIMRRAGIAGTVYVAAYIDESGNVVRTSIVKGVNEALDRAAQAAVEKTKFKPGRQRGKPIRVRLAVPIRFSLIGHKPKNEPRETKHRIHIGSYPISEGQLEVPDKAQWKAVNLEGVYDKVMLILEDRLDEKSSFALVLSYLDPDEALKLAQELQRAAESAKKNIKKFPK